MSDRNLDRDGDRLRDRRDGVRRVEIMGLNLKSIGTVRRLRDVLISAPWSVYDLLSSLIVAGIGLYLLLYPTMFQQIGGVYAPFSGIADEWIWGWGYWTSGYFGLAVTLW